MQSEIFTIDDLGYKLVIALINKRCERDIEDSMLQREELERKSRANKGDNILKNLQKKRTEKGSTNISTQMDQKRRWLQDWNSQAWKVLGSLTPDNDQNIQTLDELLLTYRMKDEQEQYKLYLILQEVVLTPLYVGLPGYTKLSEISPASGYELCSHLCGFPASIGRDIVRQSERQLKEMTEFWSKLVKHSAIGLAALAISAGIAAPIIATAIGGVMGLSGAAAYTSGLAFIGGGAIAAGGLGMAGGLSILIGGGALIGAVGGAGATKVLLKLPKEALAINLIKIVNYATYLKGCENPTAKDILNQLLQDYVDMKHTTERELLLGNLSSERENVMDVTKSLNYSYQKLLTL